MLNKVDIWLRRTFQVKDYDSGDDGSDDDYHFYKKVKYFLTNITSQFTDILL